MDIDLNILRQLEREKEIKFDVLVEAIEQALLMAYHKSPGAIDDARVVLDRKTGHVLVMAAEVDEDGLEAGDKITIVAENVPVGAIVTAEIHSTPIELGSMSVGPSGSFSMPATVPAVESGEHEIVVRAWDSSAATQPEDEAALWNPKGYVNNARPRIRVRAA